MCGMLGDSWGKWWSADTHTLACTCIIMSAHPLYKAEARMPPTVQSVSSSMPSKDLLPEPFIAFKSVFSVCVRVIWVVCWRLIEFPLSANWWHPFCPRCVWSYALWICAQGHDVSLRAVNLIKWSFVRPSSSISGGCVCTSEQASVNINDIKWVVRLSI